MAPGEDPHGARGPCYSYARPKHLDGESVSATVVGGKSSASSLFSNTLNKVQLFWLPSFFFLKESPQATI